MRRPRILVTHPWMGRGGSEAAAMWALEAVQDEFEVTFATASSMEWDELNEAFGTKVDPGRIHFFRAPRLPTVNSPARLAHLQVRYFERFCQRLAKEADLCLSAYNPVQFGKPGVQLIGDFSFSEEMRKRLYIFGDDKFRHRETLLRKAYLAIGKAIALPQVPLRRRGDLVLANSAWSAEQLEQHFGLSNAPVIYPPVVLPKAPSVAERDPMGFVCLGRIVPEKEITRIIDILEQVREQGFPAKLSLIGKLGDDSYSNLIRERISGHDWITPHGFLGLEAKQALLSSQTYALHACRIEAFGIAVAEMASMGCLPFVPDTGGATEIVTLPELQFGSNDEAVAKIISLLVSPEKGEMMRSTLVERVNQFGPEQFKAQLLNHLLTFTGLKKRSAHADSEKDLSAAY